MTETVGVRLHSDLIRAINEISNEEKAERSVILRKLLEKGINHWKLEKALTAYSKKTVTLWKAAEIAGVPIWEMLDILEMKMIPFNYDVDELTRYVREKYGKVI